MFRLSLKNFASLLISTFILSACNLCVEGDTKCTSAKAEAESKLPNTLQRVLFDYKWTADRFDFEFSTPVANAWRWDSRIIKADGTIDDSPRPFNYYGPTATFMQPAAWFTTGGSVFFKNTGRMSIRITPSNITQTTPETIAPGAQSSNFVLDSTVDFDIYKYDPNYQPDPSDPESVNRYKQYEVRFEIQGLP